MPELNAPAGPFSGVLISLLQMNLLSRNSRKHLSGISSYDCNGGENDACEVHTVLCQLTWPDDDRGIGEIPIVQVGIFLEYDTGHLFFFLLVCTFFSSILMLVVDTEAL
jgi:hypothetical protein